MARVRADSNDLLTMKQIADISGLSYWFIRALHTGAEKATVPLPQADTKIGRSPLWYRTTIKQWLKERKSLARKPMG